MTPITFSERASCPVCGHSVELVGDAKITGPAKVGRCRNCGSVNLFSELSKEANDEVFEQGAEQRAQSYDTNRDDDLPESRVVKLVRKLFGHPSR